jgi:NADPH:quinone reductase
MKAVLCEKLGDPGVLKIAQVDRPVPKRGEVLVRVAAAGLNFADSLIVRGKYQVRPPLPFSPGLECAGIVEEIGSGVSACGPGDRVLAILDYGGFAEYALARAPDVFPIPEGVELATAAAIPVAYGTSHHALTAKARLRSGEVLLVHGAAGGVGLTAVQIGKRLGASVIATAGGAEKLEIARRNGADHLVDYRQEDIRDRVKAITGGRGADVVYDPVGGDVFADSLRCTAPDGRILIIGFASGDVSQIPANIIMVKNITCIGYHWGAYRQIDPTGLRASFDELLGWISEGSLRPHISFTVGLEDFRQAFEALIQRRSTGKIVITCGDDV